MGNIAKPIVEGSTVQQILPFKLSESAGGVGEKRTSPRTGSYQRLASTSQLNSPPHRGNPSPKGNPSPESGGISHQRTGSSPAQMPVEMTRVSASNNTLPKAKEDKYDYNNDDKVIYF